MRVKNFLILLSLIIAPVIIAQNKGKEYYLVDIDTAALSKYDRQVLDSFLPLYHLSKTDSLRVFYIRMLSESLYDQNIWPRYNVLLYEAVQGKQSAFFREMKAIALNNFGYETQHVRNNLFKAKQYYYDSYNEYKSLNNSGGMAAELNNLAFICQHEGNIEKSIELYSQALDLFLKENNDRGIAIEYINIGDIYYQNKDIEKAEEMFHKALVHATRSTYQMAQANALNQLGSIYRFKKQDQKAYEFYKKAYDLYAKVGEKSKMALTLVNTCHYLAKSGKYAEAEKNLEQAVTYAKESANAQAISDIYCICADYWTNRNNFIKAITYADSAYRYSKLIGYPDLILRSSKQLSELWTRQKDFKKAVAYLEEAYLMRDSINNDAIRKATLKEQFKLEYQVKEIQLKAEQDKKDTERRQEKKRQQIIIYAVLLALVSMTILAYIIFRNYRSKKRSAAILEEKNRIIREQKHEVEEKQKEIVDSIKYAQRIQKALIASEKYIEKTLHKLQK